MSNRHSSIFVTIFNSRKARACKSSFFPSVFFTYTRSNTHQIIGCFRFLSGRWTNWFSEEEKKKSFPFFSSLYNGGSLASRLRSPSSIPYALNISQLVFISYLIEIQIIWFQWMMRCGGKRIILYNLAVIRITTWMRSVNCSSHIRFCSFFLLISWLFTLLVFRINKH